MKLDKKTALFTVFLVVLVDLMGFGIVLPLMPFYASKFQASHFMIGLLYSAYSFAQLVFSPLWGSLSDRWGRRPIMIVSTLGSSLSYVLFAFSPSFEMLLFSRLFAGIMGGNIAAAQAYVADVTTHEDRAKGMGFLGAAFGIGFVLGPAISTLLIHSQMVSLLQTTLGSSWGEFIAQNIYAVPGIFAALLSFTSFLLVVAKLPETVHASGNDPERIVRSSPFSPRFWRVKAEHGPELAVLFSALFMISVGHSTLYSAFPLFCSEQLKLSAEQVGMQFASLGLIAVLIQGGLIQILVRRFGEKNLFTVGCVIMGIGMALIPFARTAPMLSLYLALLAVGGSLNGPTLNSLISKQVAHQKVGTVMGSAQGFSALGRVIGPTWGGILFGFGFLWPFLATAVLISITAWARLSMKD